MNSRLINDCGVKHNLPLTCHQVHIAQVRSKSISINCGHRGAHDGSDGNGEGFQPLAALSKSVSDIFSLGEQTIKVGEWG